MPEIKVGVAAACLLGVVVLFQLALAVGAPWGAAAYRGRAAQDDGRLPTTVMNSPRAIAAQNV